MRDLNIAICTPTGGSCRMEYMESILRLTHYYLVHPNEGVSGMSYLYKQGSVISENRDALVGTVLKSPECSAILFVDDDMSFPVTAVQSLVRNMRETGEYIVIGNYPMKNTRNEWTCFDIYHQNQLKLKRSDTGLREAGGGGLGFALIHRRVFEAVKEPRFLNYYSNNAQGVGSYSTEDVPFYKAARRKGFRVWVDQEASKQLTHIGAFSYDLEAEEAFVSLPTPLKTLWDRNIEKLKEWEESQGVKAKKETENDV